MQEDDFSETATLESIVKLTTAMKILLFLTNDKDNDETYYLQRIADALGINEATAYVNLGKLIEAEIVCKTMSKANKKNKYYYVSNKKLAQKAIDKYKHWVGFCLARFVPYEKQYCTHLKRDARFITACEEYGLTVSEGINTVLECHKVGKENMGSDTIIWRKEQGYDKPEPVEQVKFEIKVEEVE